MTAIDRLIESLQNDPTVRRFQELERIIDQDMNLQQQYNELLDAQKIMVQRQVKKHPQYNDAKETYQLLREQLMQHVLMSEYLDLLEQINGDLKWIQEIIESEISKDFD
ncbi:YlbF family regulator [Candidatus Xianfuyuplasma coldseepsis]|uniref:YlbF family regulator n=1 Tax=Candidatus Xianfuyuplasma coldseepsis TaxID=2782163 RepID=A0A7L7KSR8_9MOLU|nr:YlbF family regulator [Xianfuyuplasma coldseepsis]QMS85645.1 YlbF family regulator [Xianfuyuplasma coldseepsis]